MDGERTSLRLDTLAFPKRLARDIGYCAWSIGMMKKADSPEKTVPIARSLRWHLVSHLPTLLLQFPEKRPQSGDKRSGVATTSFNREGDFVRFCVDIFQGKACFAKAAALANRDFK